MTDLQSYEPPPVVKPPVGPSVLGATIAGLLVAIIGAADVVYSVSWNTTKTWPFGMILMADGTGIFFQHPMLQLSAELVCAAIWIGLGVAIMVAGRRHLSAIGLAGFITTLLLLTVPIVGLMNTYLILYRGGWIGPSAYVLCGIAYTLVPIALGLAALAGRGRQANRKLIIWATALLLLACMTATLAWIWIQNKLYFANIMLVWFAAAWIVLLASVKPTEAADQPAARRSLPAEPGAPSGPAASRSAD